MNNNEPDEIFDAIAEEHNKRMTKLTNEQAEDDVKFLRAQKSKNKASADLAAKAAAKAQKEYVKRLRDSWGYKKDE